MAEYDSGLGDDYDAHDTGDDPSTQRRRRRHDGVDGDNSVTGGDDGMFDDDDYDGEEEDDEMPSDDEFGTMAAPEQTLEEKLKDLEQFAFARPMDLDDDATGALAFQEKCEKLGMKFPVQSIVARLTPDLDVLVLNHSGLGDKGIEALAECIKINSRITDLSLVDNWITPVGAKHLIDALHVNKNIKYLNLSKNRLGVQPLDGHTTPIGALIASLLQKNGTITDLKLSANKISDKDMEPIAEVLMENTTLQALDLSYNEIGAAGGTHIARIIHYNTELRDINLEWNQLRTVGSLIVLKEGLKNNNTIRVFNIAWNGVDDEGGEVLGSILENSIIERVNASHNRIGRKGAEGIANGLRSNTDLQVLLLDENPLRDEGCAAIIRAVRESRTGLVEVGLQSTGAGKFATEEYRLLKESLGKKIDVKVPKSLFAPEQW